MKKLEIMKKRNRFFLVTVALVIFGIVGILVPSVNKTAVNFGGYRLTYSYSLAEAPLPEGAIEESVTTIFPDLTLSATEPTYEEMDMTAVAQTVQTALNAKVRIIDTPEEDLGASNVVTFEIVSSVYPSDASVTALSEALSEQYADHSFVFTSVTPVSPLFTRNFVLCAAVTAILLLIVISIWLGFRLSEIGGWNVGLLVAVNALFVLIINTALFVISGIPVGYNYIYVSMSVLLISMIITMVSFQYLQDESPAITKGNLFTTIDDTITTLSKKWLIIAIVSIVAVIAGCIASASGNVGETAKLAIPVGGSLLASIYIVLFFALPFWGSSLELEEEPAKVDKPTTKKKKSTKAKDNEDEKENSDEDLDNFKDSEAARLAVEQGGAKSAGKVMPSSVKKNQTSNYSGPRNKNGGKGKKSKKKKR